VREPTVTRLLKFAHIVATIGLVGSLGLFAALAMWLQRVPAVDAPSVLQAMSWCFTRVTLPSVALLWITGLLALAVRPALLDSGWVWAKMILGMALAGLVFIGIWGALERFPEGSLVTWLGVGGAVGLAGAAFGVWRPRLWGRNNSGS
jgi:hypothetical protein